MIRKSLTRRGFLKGVAVGTTALSLSNVLGSIGRAQPDQFVSVVKGGPASFEPTINNDPNLQIVANIFDGLLRRDPQGNLQPALAVDWEQTSDEVWEFELRRGVEFHNGNSFTAEDVRYSLLRLKDDFSEFSFFGRFIENVQIVDSFNVRVTTDGAVPFFADNLHQIFILDKTSSESRSQQEIANNPIGTGAYRFVDWVPGSHVDLEANPDYWNDEAEITNVRHQEIQEDSTRIAAIESGGASLVQNVPVQSADRIKNNSNISLVTRTGRQSIFFSPKVIDGSPFEDLRVRQAVYHAIDSQAIIDVVMNGFATPASQIPDPPTTGYNSSIEKLLFDQDRARDLLRDAGFEDGFDLVVDVTNDQFVNEEGIAQAVASDLQRVGINATVRARPASVFFDDLAEKALDFFIVGWFDGAFDFGRLAGNLLVTDAFFNSSGYSNEDFDTLIEVSRTQTDPMQRSAVLRSANQLVMNDVAVIPLHYESQLWGADATLRFTARSDSWTVYHDMNF